jgi:hypothetical protein
VRPSHIVTSWRLNSELTRDREKPLVPDPRNDGVLSLGRRALAWPPRGALLGRFLVRLLSEGNMNGPAAAVAPPLVPVTAT